MNKIFKHISGLGSHFIAYSEILKNLSKRGGKIESGMRLGNFNKIKKHRNRDAFLLKMDCDRNVCLVIRRCPGIRCKAQSSVVFLVSSFELSFSLFAFYTPVVPSQFSRDNEQTHL